ncbi:MAG: MBL fold metallo-hydrolase [Deltaproteobacteria bacterium]|nr:MBL fold metallo-hydrolase [Deltaproteobacteria bacterium]
MIELECVGAARAVTGSKHVLRTSRAVVLLDCGMFQGRRREANERNRSLQVPVDEINAVVLSHAHIDHAGLLPLLYKRGYRGPVYATPATRDLCTPMLLDAAMIQEADARHIHKLIERDRLDMEPVEPLYTHEDVTGLLGQLVGLPYRRAHAIAPGIVLKLLDAGHVLGSSIIVLDVEDDGVSTRVAFAVDLGRKGLPILRDPEIPGGVNCLITESTYGDRHHPPIEEVDSALAEVVNRTVRRGGKIMIPAFALERAQEVVYALKRLRATQRVPAVPVYVDSPLTVKLTDVFKMHPECYDKQTYARLVGGDPPFEFEGLHYVADKEESKGIAAQPGPCIIIAASGMCEAGRILHHLREGVEDQRNTILIVGFQAQHTLGRRIVERQPEVKVFGVMRRLIAEVAVLSGFSAHADQKDLLDFAEAVRERGKLHQVVLVHGEPPAQDALMGKLAELGFPTVIAPVPGEKIRL